MFNGNSDREWEKFGREDPYFGVITHDRFRKENLSEEHRDEFFASGEDHIRRVLATIRERLDPSFIVDRALDFGCGVGRLVIPLAGFADEVTGVDVSDSMLNEARENCKARGITNVTFIKSDDCLSLLKGKYNLIHSCIVFQHIPVKRGERIFNHLLKHLKEKGVGVVQFTYAKQNTNRKLIAAVKDYVPFAANCYNMIRGRGFFAPRLQMNSYDINKLFVMIQNTGISDGCFEFTNHGGELGVQLYFTRP